MACELRHSRIGNVFTQLPGEWLRKTKAVLMYSKLLVPLDGSKTAEAVLPVARHLAASLKISTELLAVIDLAEMAAHLSADKARIFDELIANEEKNSARYLRRIADTFRGVDVKQAVERGRADEVIALRGTGEGVLTAIATHGRSGLGRVLLGSVVEKVLRATRNPMLVVRADEKPGAKVTEMLKNIIVPLDGSELAESILPEVAELAKALNLELTLFRAYHISYENYGAEDNYAVFNSDEWIAAARAEAVGYLDKIAARVRSLGVAKVTCLTKEGLPADEIISVGRKTQEAMIAMGSHGRSGLKRAVLGSVSEAVVRHATVPVLVLRPG